ncbi:hypothetical protein BKA82DRAFT_1007908 [Pisolithus tinctorius]|uniref:Uncharacterized protein n=1 Tax=Pisolithus tinctorius Marx 270 TaxID=870435 RepID=A0A0C3N1E3_PISTI|nr:hypothetical protein BKA82DRAFT_1007908 [Pisolithus tinctorius]KIN94894.1 hypothetical protein M404DRAFT_1007908 [Pisolithus tinctorius Marx 270]
MAAPDQVLINFPRQLIKKTNLPTPIPYACPTPSQSQSHSTSYFTTHDHISFCPAFPAPIRTPTSQYPQPHFGYHLAVQSHFTAPVDLPGFCEFRAGTKMELHEIGTFDNHPLPTLPDHSAGMTSGGIANHGKTDGNKCNYIAAKVKVLCRWCALSTEKKVTRKNLLRHLREAHLHYPR